MEKLEFKALQTAPADCRPKIRKRYVDDVLDVIKKNQVKNFTDHLNSIDDTNSIKFIYEEETNGVIPFLDLLINRQPDKTVKIQVGLYLKPTHTDQYLHPQCNRTNRSVDDIMELLEFICSTTYFTFNGTIVRAAHCPFFTDHLNSIDDTNSIKFT